MSKPSDSSELSSQDTESTPQTSTEVTESYSNKPSAITSSTNPRIPPGRKIWQPGQSGNPNGRPKGTKNAITLLKQSLELQLREQSKSQLPKVLKKAVELALAGDRLMIKLLLELHMSKQVHQEDESGGKSQVAVVIQNLTDHTPKGPVIDVQVVEVAQPSKD